jgi:NADH-quinone oxidoreductase subunit E
MVHGTHGQHVDSRADAQRLQQIIDSCGRDKSNLISILQAVHAAGGYLSYEAIGTIARELQISPHDIYGTASFYAQFKFQKPGRHHIKVCSGTACFVGGGDVLLEAIKATLHIAPGETSADGMFSLERVACLGCCALSPVVTIDDEVHANMNPARLARAIEKTYREDKV